MFFPTLQEVKSTMEKYNLSLFEGTIVEQADIIIPTDTESVIENFCRLASDNSIKTIFINVETLEEESLRRNLINLESITSEDYGSSFKEILKKARAYNKNIEELARQGPIGIELFFVLNGKICSIDFTEEWYLESPSPDDAMEEFTFDYQDEIEQIEEAREQKEVEQLETFIEMLIQDKEFKKCTTERERRYHAFYAWKKISDKFMGIDDVEPHAREAWEFIQREERNNRQENINKFADLLSMDDGFRKCTNMGSRKTYASNFIKNHTGETVKSGILEQIVNSAKAKQN